MKRIQAGWWALVGALVLASQAAAQQATPEQQLPPVQQPAPTQAPAQQPPEAPAPETQSIPESPPPFPPMPARPPRHRWVDVGTPRTNHVRRRSSGRHHVASAEARQHATHLSRRAIRFCRSLNRRQLRRHGECTPVTRSHGSIRTQHENARPNRHHRYEAARADRHMSKMNHHVHHRSGKTARGDRSTKHKRHRKS
jgi:hypothetical protein